MNPLVLGKAPSKKMRRPIQVVRRTRSECMRNKHLLRKEK